MPQMNQKNMMLNSAATDLGVGTALKVQVDNQVDEQKKRLNRGDDDDDDDADVPLPRSVEIDTLYHFISS